MDPYVSVEGRRSARWAFMEGMTIKDKQGHVYLDRLRLVQTPWFGIFIHAIIGPDPDPDPHDHPWNFWSLILCGGYIEHYYIKQDGRVLSRRWPRWSLRKMAAEGVAHKITSVKKNTWTLVLVGRRQRDWGFWTSDGWVYFREYEKRVSRDVG